MPADQQREKRKSGQSVSGVGMPVRQIFKEALIKYKPHCLPNSQIRGIHIDFQRVKWLLRKPVDGEYTTPIARKVTFVGL